MLAVVLFHTPFCFKIIWKIALIQLRHFCIGRKLSFGQTAVICIIPAYSDRLAFSFRSAAAAEIFIFRVVHSYSSCCCVGPTQFQLKPKQLYKSSGLFSGASRVGSVLQSWFPFIYISVPMWYVFVSHFQSVQRATCDYQFWASGSLRRQRRPTRKPTLSKFTACAQLARVKASACSAAYAVSNQLPVSRRTVDH